MLNIYPDRSPSVRGGNVDPTDDTFNDEELDYGTPVECTISIDGSVITTDIYSVHLEQHVDRHHVLTVKLRELGLESDRQEFGNPKEFTDYLGKVLSLKMAPTGEVVDSARKLEFIGPVTEIRLDHGINFINTVVVTAMSPTISLDAHQRDRVFGTGQDCSGIVNGILGDYQITKGTIDGAAVATVSESLTMEVDSGVQYRETDYDYIKRLASEHKMFAYYDGTKFFVEKAKSNDEEELEWRQTLGSFALGVGSAPLSFYGRVWNPTKKEVVETEASKKSVRASLSDFSGASLKASETIYPTMGVSSAPKHPDQSKADAAIAREAESAAGRMMVCKGVSIVPAVKVGSCIKVKGMGDIDGQYWVQSIVHTVRGGAKYSNRFTCTPLDLALPDLKREQQPFTHLMTGIVTDNNDPQALGRIKVRMPWHRDEETEFMRMLTPDGGMERGWFALPEIDDEVLVGYERGNPDMPIVMGCLYNHKDKPPVPSSEAVVSKQVEVKVFRTRNGNEIRFDDAGGSEKITISQKDGTNVMVMDMSGPSIAITSDNGDISITGKNITLEATSGNIEMKAGADITAKASSNIKAEASMNMELKGGMDFKSEGGMNYKAKGGLAFEAKGGVSAKLDGGPMTEIKGAIVKIN